MKTKRARKQWWTNPGVRPTAAERAAIKRGMMVKMSFGEKWRDHPGREHAEAMWVEVTSIDRRAGIVKGLLANQPALMESLRFGDSVSAPFSHLLPLHKPRGMVRVNDFAVREAD